MTGPLPPDAILGRLALAMFQGGREAFDTLQVLADFLIEAGDPLGPVLGKMAAPYPELAVVAHDTVRVSPVWPSRVRAPPYALRVTSDDRGIPDRAKGVLSGAWHWTLYCQHGRANLTISGSPR